MLARGGMNLVRGTSDKAVVIEKDPVGIAGPATDMQVPLLSVVEVIEKAEMTKHTVGDTLIDY